MLDQGITEIRGRPRDGLLSVSIVFTLWAASAGMRAVTNALRWPAVVVLLLLVVALIYYLGPNVDQPFRYVTPGSVAAVLVWILASAGFSAYVARFGSYGATYGSLGGIVVLLLYFFVSGAVLLFGAEINATIHPAEHVRTDDPITGPDIAATGEICREPLPKSC